MGGWVRKKTKLMLYSTLVEIEVEVGVELGKKLVKKLLLLIIPDIHTMFNSHIENIIFQQTCSQYVRFHKLSCFLLFNPTIKTSFSYCILTPCHTYYSLPTQNRYLIHADNVVETQCKWFKLKFG